MQGQCCAGDMLCRYSVVQVKRCAGAVLFSVVRVKCCSGEFLCRFSVVQVHCCACGVLCR